MKILHLSYKDAEEGAAIAVDRLCESLVQSGIDSKILVYSKVSDKKYSSLLAINRYEKLKIWIKIRLDLLVNKILIKNKSIYYTLPFIGTDIVNNKFVQEADLIHIHWINRGFLSIGSIEKLLKLNKPIVWTLHDSWAFTGGCHMVGKCEQYMDNCASCDISRVKFLTHYFFNFKYKVFKKKNLFFIAPSEWTKNRAKRSIILNNKSIKVLPNCVNREIFKKRNKIEARDCFSLSKNKKIVLFYISNDPRKGGQYISSTIKYFKKNGRDDILFVGFGTSDLSNTIYRDMDIISMGRIDDTDMLAKLYSSADILLAPALEEPFGQTYIEAMSVGTPCIAFNYSGPLDIIEHKKDGYLAELNNVDDVIKGVDFCLNNLETLQDNAINKIELFFSYKSVSSLFEQFYQSILKNEVNY